MSHAHDKSTASKNKEKGSGSAAPEKLRVQPSPQHILQRVQADPHSITPTDIRTLQRTIGNQATMRALASSQVLQAKLKLGPAGDRYEQEADRVADQVVRSMDQPSPAQKGSVQREGEEEELQMKPLAAVISAVQRSPLSTPAPDAPKVFTLPPAVQREVEEEELLQGKALHGPEGGEVDNQVESSIQAARGGGKPLDDGIRGSMEQGFGADFSNVRVHTGGQADALNRSLNAKAFTVGSDVFFGKGQYNPGSGDGQKLIAHELTHTVQQGAVRRQLNRTSFPSRQSGPGLTLQRRLNFATTDLGGSLTARAWIAGVFGNESTFAQLRKELANYWKSERLGEQLASLQILKQLATTWLSKHDKDKKKDQAKADTITNLLDEVNKEIPIVQKAIQDEKDEQDNYIQQIEDKSLDYMTGSGYNIYEKIKGWSKGEGYMEGQGTAVQALMQQYGLTLAEASAIGIYTADDYKYMNPAMANSAGWMKAQLPKTGIKKQSVRTAVYNDFSKTPDDNAQNQHVAKATQEGQLHGKMAVAGMKKLPNWTGTTFRGLALTEQEIQQQYAKNATVRFDAFSSTSKKEGTSRGFARSNATGGKVGILLYLQLSKGKDIAILSNSAGEDEILLMPGASFTVTSITETTYKGDKMYEARLKQTQ